MPFHEQASDYKVVRLVSKGKRPSKPDHFDVIGMTPAVWKIAEKCWRQKPKQRLEVSAVLKHLEDLAKPCMYTREA